MSLHATLLLLDGYLPPDLYTISGMEKQAPKMCKHWKNAALSSARSFNTPIYLEFNTDGKTWCLAPALERIMSGWQETPRRILAAEYRPPLGTNDLKVGLQSSNKTPAKRSTFD
jgi:hypothetical protein